MASVKITEERTLKQTPWYKFNREERLYIKKFQDLTLNISEISENGLIREVTRTGSIELCREFLNELNDPSTVYNNRKKYCDENGIKIMYTLIP